MGFIASSGYAIDRIQGTPEALDEFLKTEEFVKYKKIASNVKDRTLKKNLVSAVKFSILKRYPDFKERTKDLKPENVSFYQEDGAFTYFVKYKDYYGQYFFVSDPELYIQQPVDERFYLRPEEFKDEKPAAAPGTGPAPKKDSAPPTK